MAGMVFNFDHNSEYVSDDNPSFGGSYTDLCGYQVAAFGFPLETSAQMGDVIKQVLWYLSCK